MFFDEVTHVETVSYRNVKGDDFSWVQELQSVKRCWGIVYGRTDGYLFNYFLGKWPLGIVAPEGSMVWF